jgi:hypothetical protein
MMRYWWDNIAAEALDRVQNLSKARSSVKVQDRAKDELTGKAMSTRMARNQHLMHSSVYARVTE